MKILIFDTETGGLNAYRNDILQLSFQVIDGDTFHTLLESNYYFHGRKTNAVWNGELFRLMD